MNYGYKVTTNGRKVLAACLAAEMPPTMTRVSFGSGTVAEDVDLADVHELVSYVTDGKVTEKRHENDRFYMTLQYANEFNKTLGSFIMGEFIVWAKDPETEEEVDFLYATLGDYTQSVPAYNPELPVSVWDFPLVVVISDDVEVKVEAPVGLVSYTELEKTTIRIIEQTAADMQAAMNSHEESEESHGDIRQAAANAMSVARQAYAVAANGPSIIIEPSFVVPAEGWEELETAEVVDDENYAYRLELEVEGSTEEHYPELKFNKASKIIAADAGLCPEVETQDGVLVLWSKTVPSAELTGTLILIRANGGSSADAEPYILPVATAGTLGGVKIPSNSGLLIDAQGNLRVNKASSGETSDGIEDIFGDGTGSGSDTDTDTGDEGDSSGTGCEHEVATDEEVQTEVIDAVFGN